MLGLLSPGSAEADVSVVET